MYVCMYTCMYVCMYVCNADWPTVTAAADANDFWAMWKDRFLHIIDKHAPRRTIKV